MLFSPICIIPVILQAACVLVSLVDSARSGLCPKGATHHVVQHADIFVTQLELFRVYIRSVYFDGGYIPAGYNQDEKRR